MTCNCKNKCKNSVKQYKEDVIKELKKRLDSCFIGSEETQRTVENAYWDTIQKQLGININNKENDPFEEEYEVYVRSNGKKTKATLFHNGKYVCSAKSTTHKQDEQDFNIGASLALNRLLEKATRLDDIEEIEKDIEYRNHLEEEQKKGEIRRVLSETEKVMRETLKQIPHFEEMTKFLDFKDLCALLIGAAEEYGYDKNQKN